MTTGLIVLRRWLNASATSERCSAHSKMRSCLRRESWSRRLLTGRRPQVIAVFSELRDRGGGKSFAAAEDGPKHPTGDRAQDEKKRGEASEGYQPSVDNEQSCKKNDEQGEPETKANASDEAQQQNPFEALAFFFELGNEKFESSVRC